MPALLDSLKAQTVGLDAFRVIFVDNASTDDTRAIVESYRDSLNIRYIFEPQPGKVFALNTGYQAAATEYVAQTDGDCKVDEHWLENILTVIDEESPDLLGGPYYPYYNSDKPRWYKDAYNTFVDGNTRKVLRDSYLCGANMVWQRELVLSIGGHNPEVSITGTGIVGGEDTELIVRARKLHPNLRIIYDPNIIVFHLTKAKNFNTFYQLEWRFLHGKNSLYIWQPNIRGYFELWAILVIAFTWIIVKTSILWIFRDKNVYKYYQNYLIEMVGPDFSLLGRTFEALFHRSAILNSQR